MKRRKIKANKLPQELQHVNLDAAGIDIGSTSHFVCVPVGRDKENVREFESFTQDLYELADWLKQCKIKTVAMESTGVYWIPLFEILEASGFEVRLVNSKHVKNVPGRKSDVLDCQWIQQLHTYGLLQGSFRPADHMCSLRGYMRHRDNLVKTSASHIQHIQKALCEMNIQLHNVLSDIAGATGIRMIRAIVAGERDPKTLAQMRDDRCKNSLEVIEKSLVGNYRGEHVFALKQALELYDVYQEKLAECDREIERLLATFKGKPEEGSHTLPKQPQKKRRKNELYANIHPHIYRITGVDLTQIDGLDTHSVLKLVAEVGSDMNRWPTAKHFGSWMGLAPGTKISGGKKLSSRTKTCANRAAAIFRVAANTLSRSNTALGSFLRRKKAQLGAPQAITATAYKLARIFYTILKTGKAYVDLGANYFEEQHRKQSIKHLARKAKLFGLKLIEDNIEGIEKNVSLSMS
jgi:transposase